MLSSYSKGDVSAKVERLVRGLLKKYPTLMFTTSAVSNELAGFHLDDIREALLRESERGLLQPYLQWRCTECDSPVRNSIDKLDPSGYCEGCERDREYESILYFIATDALMRDLEDPPDDDPKKAAAATEESIERVALASRSPRQSDIISAEDRPRIEEALEKMVHHAARAADATEASLPHVERTATATQSMARDWRPIVLTVIGIVVAIVGIVVTIVLAESHFFDRFFPRPAPNQAATSPASSKSNHSREFPRASSAP